MNISQNIREAYSEVDEFIQLLDAETREKIPEIVRVVFKEEKDKEYRKHINPDMPIKEQNLKEDTLAIIALLNLKYICEDEAEKERLMLIYEENEKRYEEIMKVDFDSKDIFSQNSYQNLAGEDLSGLPKSLEAKEESIIRKIINKIKHVFKK